MCVCVCVCARARVRACVGRVIMSSDQGHSSIIYGTYSADNKEEDFSIIGKEKCRTGELCCGEKERSAVLLWQPFCAFPSTA